MFSCVLLSLNPHFRTYMLTLYYYFLFVKASINKHYEKTFFVSSRLQSVFIVTSSSTNFFNKHDRLDSQPNHAQSNVLPPKFNFTLWCFQFGKIHVSVGKFLLVTHEYLLLYNNTKMNNHRVYRQGGCHPLCKCMVSE